MEYRIVLTASDNTELNKLIDHKLKEGYLLESGMCDDEQNELQQSMVLSTPIDSEMTVASGLKLAVFLVVWVTVMSFITNWI